MAWLKRVHPIGWLCCLALYFGTGCGAPGSHSFEDRKASLTLQNQHTTRFLPTMKKVSPIHMSLQNTSKRVSTQQGIQSEAPSRRSVSNQKHVHVTSPRYIDLRIHWRGRIFRVTSDLEASTFSMDVSIPKNSLRLRCTPRKDKRQKVHIQPNPLTRVTQTSREPKLKKTGNGIVRFEQDGQALVQRIWSGVRKLWGKRKCLTKTNCASHLYSDITLDVQGEKPFSCAMILVKKSSQKP